MWTVRVLRAVHTDEEHPGEVHPGVKRKKSEAFDLQGLRSGGAIGTTLEL